MKSEKQIALESYELLDTSPEEEYDNITRLASFICDAPIALVNLVADDRQFFKSRIGLDVEETPLIDSFCRYLIENESEALIVEDARKDTRFKHYSTVTGPPYVVFYAGFPLINHEGHRLGTLCVVDQKPKKLNDRQIDSLKALASQLLQLLELRKNRIELNAKNLLLNKEAKRLNNVLQATQTATWEWNVQTGEVIFNERWAEILGYSLEELEPISIQTWYDLVHPDDAEYSQHKLEQCLRGEIDFYDIECRMLHKDGRSIWVNDRGQVISWTGEGLPLLMMGSHIDITARKERESQFKAITTNMPGLVLRYVRNPEGEDRISSVSMGAKSMWGLCPEEIEQNNQRAWDLVYKDDLPLLLHSINDSAESGNLWQFEWRYHHSDGDLRWQRGSGSPIKQNDGRIIWDSLILDVTEEKNARTQLEHSERRFKALAHGGSDLTGILDREGNYIYMSSAAKPILGMEPGDFIGKNSFDFIHPGDKEMVFDKFRDLKTEKEVVIDAFRFRDKEGKWRWTETVLTNLLRDPAVNGIVANSRDITEKKLFLDELKESQKRYSELFHLSPQPMWVYEIETLQFLDVNEAAVKTYGFSYDEFLNLSVLDLIDSSERERMQEVIDSSSSSGNSYFHEGEFVHLKKNKEKIIVDLRGNYITHQGRNCKIILATDITALHKHIRSIEEQNEKLQQIAWTQSHIVRAPLARIMGLINLIEEENTTPEERASLMRFVKGSASELDTIIRDIVRKSKPISQPLKD